MFPIHFVIIHACFLDTNSPIVLVAGPVCSHGIVGKVR